MRNVINERGMVLVRSSLALIWIASVLARAGELPLVPPGIKLQESVIGRVFADSSGHTLYFLEEESRGHGRAFKPVCAEECIRTWKPVVAPALAHPIGEWSFVRRDDGGMQWAYQGRPLYTYADDRDAGQVAAYENNIAHWQAAVYERAFLPDDVKLRHTADGWVFVTKQGMSLYSLERPGIGGDRTGKTQPKPQACDDACLQVWRPLLGTIDSRTGGNWSLVKRNDDTLQWAYDGKAVYTYSKDKQPGDALGDIEQYFTGGRAFSWRVLTPLDSADLKSTP